MLKVTRAKSSIVVIGLLLFTLLSLSSCDDASSDPADTNTLGLPKTISELYQDGSQVGNLNGKVTYDGSKIVQIYYNDAQKKVFTYTGEFITNIEDYQAGVVRFEHTYTYDNGKLIEYDSQDLLTGNNDHITYTHNTDGTISYIQIFSFSGRQDWKKEGLLTFENQNLVQDVAEFSFYGISDEYNLIVNVLEYNDKQNPFKNISGYSLLLNLKGTIGNENIISDYTYSTSFKNGVQYAESITGKEYEFTYDKNDRTIQIDRYTNENTGGDLLYLDRIFKFKY